MPTFSMAESRRKLRLPLGVGGMDGTDDSKLSDLACDNYNNHSYQALLVKHDFREKEIVATVPTVAGTRNYTMPDPHDGLRHISIQDPVSLQWTPLDRMSVDDYMGRWNASTDQRGYPTHYVRESCVFRLWPTPDDVYTLMVRYWGILVDLADSTTSIVIPNVWWEPIIAGGIIRAALDLGMNEKADIWGKWQEKLINDIPSISGKEEEDSHRSGLEVLGREY